MGRICSPSAGAGHSGRVLIFELGVESEEWRLKMVRSQLGEITGQNVDEASVHPALLTAAREAVEKASRSHA